MDLAYLVILHTQQNYQMRRSFELYGLRLSDRDTAIARMPFQRASASVVPTAALPVTRNDWLGIPHPCGRGLSLKNRLERRFQAAR